VGAKPEHTPAIPKAGHDDPVTWINREPVPVAAAGGSDVPASGVPKWLRTGSTRWVVLGLLLLLLIAGVVAVRSTAPTVADDSDSATPPPLVTVTVPGVVAVTTRVSFTGTVSARYDMPIGVEGDGGRIIDVRVEAGDRVKAGQVMAVIDESILRPQVNRLLASLEEARAQAALSLAEYRRAEGVRAAGALSAEEIERRRAASITDDARVNVAAAQLAEAQARLGHNNIRAPSNGTVLTRTAEIGQTAMPGGDPLFRLARDSEVEMRGQIAEQDLAALKIGQPAAVYLTGISKPFEGKVRLLGAVIDPQTRLGEIRVALEPDPSLRPGAFARGQVTVESAERPVLPQTAVLSDVKGSYVFVVNDKNILERRPVRVANAAAQGIVIAEGITGNERIVATAGGFLREGEVVEIAKPATPAEVAQVSGKP